MDTGYHYPMPNLRSLTLHLDEETLRRLEVLAEVKGTDHLALAAEFLTERLGEEEPKVHPESRTRAGAGVHEGGPSTAVVEIYTDGGCRGNPGPGGWAALVYDEGPNPKEISGADRSTTNQRMEIRAAVEGLRSLESPTRAKVYSDSAYLINALKEGWLAGCRRWWTVASTAASTTPQRPSPPSTPDCAKRLSWTP
jgi:hypothetical protein